MSTTHDSRVRPEASSIVSDTLGKSSNQLISRSLLDANTRSQWSRRDEVMSSDLGRRADYVIPSKQKCHAEGCGRDGQRDQRHFARDLRHDIKGHSRRLFQIECILGADQLAAENWRAA